MLAIGAAGLLPSAFAQIDNIVVTSAASFQVGLPPPGSIGTIFCTGLSVPGLVTAAGVPLPYSLEGITVTIGGAQAPLFAVAELSGYQQINFQVPSAAEWIPGMDGYFAVDIQQNGTLGSATATSAVPVSAGDFFRLPGTSYGIFQHSADYSLVTENSPAHPGEILVTYLTGVGGGLAYDVPDGQAAPLSPVDPVLQSSTTGFSHTYNMVVNGAAIGAIGDPNALLFIGLAPGMVGVYQINFALPESMASGDVQITLRYTVNDSMFGLPFAYNSAAVLLPVW